MPFIVVCPECNAQLKSNTLVAAGRTLVCPSCKTKFTTEEDSEEVGGGSKASVSVPPTPPKPKAKPSRNDDDFEDEDEDSPPKKKKTSRNADLFDDEEEDDRPKKKGKASRDEDEDEDERPKKKVKASRDDDEDEDDRPAKKSKKKSRDDNEDDDDDFDDRPSKKGKKGKKGKQKSKMPLIIGLAAVVLLCGGCGLTGVILYFTDNLPFFGGGSYKELAKYVPSDADAVIMMDMKTLINDPDVGSEFKKDINKDKDDPFNQTGLSLDDIEKAIVIIPKSRVGGGGKQPLPGGAPAKEIIVAKLSKAVVSSELKDKLKATEVTFNNQKYFKTATNAFFMPDSKILVMSNEAGIQAALGASTATPNEKLTKLFSQANGHVSTISANPDSGFSCGLDLYVGFADLGGMLGGGGNQPKPQSVVSNIKLKSETVSYTYTVAYADEATATSETDKRNSKLEKAKQNISAITTNMNKGGGGFGPKLEASAVTTMIEGARVSRSGSVMTVTYEGPKKGKGASILFGF